MHIAINCRSFSKKQFTGIGRYASSLVASLSAIDAENRYSLYTNRGWSDFKSRITRRDASNFAVKFDWLNRGAAKTLRSVDIYHAPSPEIAPDLDAKLVVTVHDLIYKTYPQGHTQETLALSDVQFQSFIPRAARIICSSRSTQNDLCRYFPSAKDKSCYIYQGVDTNSFYPLPQWEIPSARDMLREKGVRGPFVLFVGTIEPRKNLKGLLEAFAWLKQRKFFDGKLAVVGMAGWKGEGLAGLIEHLGIRDDVVFQGFVSNDELRVFYNLAEVFVFPSFYEGFGYPILEAFNCGAAVVTSNVSSCPELAADAAFTVDPVDSEAIARAMGRILQDSGLKSVLKHKALARAREFDNLKTARETLAVYKEVYKG
ncbi:MAG: glycosyltransferase family 4 protein [Candidatus Omnitrophica bacterium]|nr:glycosyltransferase family 4 protein [Candidatus Omnitrophota bacterium]